MRIGFIQMKPELLSIDANLEKTARFLRQAVEEKAELVVLPELFDSDYNFRDKQEVLEIAQPIPDGKTTQFLINEAQRHGMFIVAAMPIRCLENRVFSVTANRIGKERGLRFIGKSQISLPKAEVLLRANKNKEEVGAIDVDLNMARDKRINEYNDIFADRRKEFYSL